MIFELVLNSVYYGQQCVNRWNYISTGVPAGISLSQALLRAGGFVIDDELVPPAFPSGTLFAAIRGVSTGDLSYVQATALAIKDTLDFYQVAMPSGTNGTLSGQGDAPYVASGFRTNIVNRAIRRGTKRFAGFPDALTEAGGAINPTMIGFMETLAEKMSETLTYDDDGNTLTFAPCVCKKQEYVPDPAHPEKKAYRYYPTLAEQVANTATGVAWEIYNTTRSQVSRQRGRGA